MDLLLGQRQVQYKVLMEVEVQLGVSPKDQRTVEILNQFMATISVFYYVWSHTQDSHLLASSYFGFHSILALRIRNLNQSAQLKSPLNHHWTASERSHHPK